MGLLHKKDNRLLLIRFELIEEEDILYCEIRDNGVGRERAAEIKSRNPIKRKSFATLLRKKAGIAKLWAGISHWS